MLLSMQEGKQVRKVVRCLVTGEGIGDQTRICFPCAWPACCHLFLSLLVLSPPQFADFVRSVGDGEVDFNDQEVK